MAVRDEHADRDLPGRVLEAFDAACVTDEAAERVRLSALQRSGEATASRGARPRPFGLGRLVMAAATVGVVLVGLAVWSSTTAPPSAQAVITKALARLDAYAGPGLITHEKVVSVVSSSGSPRVVETVETWRSYSGDRVRVTSTGSDGVQEVVADRTHAVAVSGRPPGALEVAEYIGDVRAVARFFHYRWVGRCDRCHPADSVTGDSLTPSAAGRAVLAARNDVSTARELLRGQTFVNRGTRTFAGKECWVLRTEMDPGYAEVYVDRATSRMVGSRSVSPELGSPTSTRSMRVIEIETVKPDTLPPGFFTVSVPRAGVVWSTVAVSPSVAASFTEFPLYWLGPTFRLGGRTLTAQRVFNVADSDDVSSAPGRVATIDYGTSDSGVDSILRVTTYFPRAAAPALEPKKSVGGVTITVDGAFGLTDADRRLLLRKVRRAP